jgi:uncharacterized protein with HEPN domain
MMRDKLIYILTAYQCIQAINDYIAGYELANFLEDKKTQDAVIRNLDVLVQTLSGFGLNALQQKYPNVSWQHIVQAKHLVSYRALGVDNKVAIWELVSHQNLAACKAAIEELFLGIQGC